MNKLNVKSIIGLAIVIGLLASLASFTVSNSAQESTTLFCDTAERGWPVAYYHGLPGSCDPQPGTTVDEIRFAINVAIWALLTGAILVAVRELKGGKHQ